MSDQREGISIERAIGAVALCTTGYYLFTYAIEVGFFWLPGLQFMSAFSLSDHVNHAAASLIGIFGAALFAFAMMLMMIGYIPMHLAAPGEPRRPDDETERSGRSSSITARVAYTALLIISVAAMGFLIVVETDARPSDAILPLLVLATASFAYWKIWQRARGFWILPAIMALVVSPIAFGDALYRIEISKPILPSERFKVGDHNYDGRPVFVGSDKAIFRTPAGMFLATFDGDMVIQIVPDVPAHWQISGRTPCKSRPRNDPGPRDVFCEPISPPRPPSKPKPLD